MACVRPTNVLTLERWRKRNRRTGSRRHRKPPSGNHQERLASPGWWGLLFTPAGVKLNSLVFIALFFGAPLLYFALTWGRFGATIGTRLLGLRIVRAGDGGPIGYRTAAVRLVTFVALLATCVAVVNLGLLALPVVLDPRRRGLHDRFAGTFVLRPAYGRTS